MDAFVRLRVAWPWRLPYVVRPMAKRKSKAARTAASSTAERKDARRTRCGSPIARRTGGLAFGFSHLVGESAGERVEIAEMGAQVAQHAADGVAVIVGAVLAVVDGVSAAAVRVSLEQAELT